MLQLTELKYLELALDPKSETSSLYLFTLTAAATSPPAIALLAQWLTQADPNYPSAMIQSLCSDGEMGGEDELENGASKRDYLALIFNYTPAHTSLIQAYNSGSKEVEDELDEARETHYDPLFISLRGEHSDQGYEGWNRGDSPTLGIFVLARSSTRSSEEVIELLKTCPLIAEVAPLTITLSIMAVKGTAEPDTPPDGS